MSDAIVDRDLLGLSSEYREPESPLEKTVAGIWQRHFSMDRIGIHDRYEELGGDSLLAVKIIIDVEKELSRQLSWNTLEEADTIAKMCAAIRGMKEMPV